MWGKFSTSGEQEASRIVEKKRERPSVAREALARLRLMECGKWSRHLNQGTFRRQQKQPQFAQPILRNTRKGKTVAAVRAESDDEKRWMEVKADRGKKEGRA
jgi:hypothetical protein